MGKVNEGRKGGRGGERKDSRKEGKEESRGCGAYVTVTLFVSTFSTSFRLSAAGKLDGLEGGRQGE